MITVFTADHRLHDSKVELFAGKLVPSFEKPERADVVADRIRAVGVGEIVPPRDFPLDVLARVHSRSYLEFLGTFWAQWTAAGYAHNGYPTCERTWWMGDRAPGCVEGQVSRHCHDFAAPLTSGTWRAARASANVALSAQEIVRKGARAAFGLCRPPGHHAYIDSCGGYCYLNNAAIAAQACLDDGAARVAILDVDFHHGNGTQAIFYRRSDVFYGSVHGHPDQCYPYFLGYADERGSGSGEGFNRNYPLRPGVDGRAWFAALEELLKEIRQYGPDELIVSLGVDAFEGDPISRFRLSSTDFSRLGECLGAQGYRTVFVFEGGYAVDALGTNVTNVLEGFEGRHS